jgi:hypothetical protein
MNKEFPKVRIEIGPAAIFTRVYIDEKELKGITRVWFDSGDVDAGDRPRKAFRDLTRVHIEFYPQELIVEGETEVDFIEERPRHLVTK